MRISPARRRRRAGRLERWAAPKGFHFDDLFFELLFGRCRFDFRSNAPGLSRSSGLKIQFWVFALLDRGRTGSGVKFPFHSLRAYSRLVQAEAIAAHTQVLFFVFRLMADTKSVRCLPLFDGARSAECRESNFRLQICIWTITALAIPRLRFFQCNERPVSAMGGGRR